MYVLFPEKLFYPTHTINQLQTKQPLSNKDVLLPPYCWCTHTLNTHTLNFRRRHTDTLSRTPLRFLYSRGFFFVITICAWRAKSNEAEEEGNERKGVFLLMEGRSSVASLCRWTLLLHQWPHAQRATERSGGYEVDDRHVCVYVCLMHDSEAQLTQWYIETVKIKGNKGELNMHECGSAPRVKDSFRILFCVQYVSSYLCVCKHAHTQMLR